MQNGGVKNDGRVNQQKKLLKWIETVECDGKLKDLWQKIIEKNGVDTDFEWKMFDAGNVDFEGQGSVMWWKF